MSRIRQIKHGLYLNPELHECSIAARYLFPGLWVLADREGRLEDRPNKIKVALLPADNEDIDALLGELADKGFILRYEAEGEKYIQVVKFHKHQKPHPREAASTIPPPLDCLGLPKANLFTAPVGDDDDDDGDDAGDDPEEPDGKSQLAEKAGDSGASQNAKSRKHEKANLSTAFHEKEVVSRVGINSGYINLGNGSGDGSSAPRRELQQLAQCCDLDLRTIDYRSLSALDKDLSEMRAVNFDFGLLPRFRDWWERHDWRGKKGQSPTVRQVRDNWGVFARWLSANNVLPLPVRTYCGECKAGWVKVDPANDFSPVARCKCNPERRASA